MVRLRRPQQSDGGRQLGGTAAAIAIKNAEDGEMKKETAEIMEIIRRRPELALSVLRLALRQAESVGILPEDDQQSAQSA